MGWGKKALGISAVFLVLFLWKPVIAVVALIAFLSFRIYVKSRSKGPNRTVTKGGSPVFLGKGETLELAGYAIQDPMIWVADCARKEDADASLLCLRRKISRPRREPPKALGYYPHLSELRPYQVGNYLQWLANGKGDPNMDLGYVFIYFYGLERCSLVEGMNVVQVAAEVIRLVEVYGTSRSLRGYGTGLLIHLVFIGRLLPTRELIDKLIELQDRFISEELAVLILGHLAREESPLPAEWALVLARQDERAFRSIVTRNVPDELLVLFQKRYRQKFDEGLVPKTSGRERAVGYHPASPTLLSAQWSGQAVPDGKWPVVVGWKKQFAKVVNIYNDCVSELRRFSRKVQSQGVDSVEAFEALPEELRETSEHPLQGQWEDLLADCAPEEGPVLLPIHRIAELKGIKHRPRLTKTQSEAIAQTAEFLGDALEPDSRYTGKTYRWDQLVAVVRLPDEPLLPEDGRYLAATHILRLALEVARADDRVDESERSAIVSCLQDRFGLERNEKIRLDARIEILQRENPSLAGLKKFICTQLTEEQREAIGRLLVEIASVSEGIASSEIAALRRVFRTLQLDASVIPKYLDDFGYVVPEAPVVAQRGASDSGGEPIPPPRPTLSIEKIREKRRESDEAARMLVQVMGVDVGAEPDTEDDISGEEEEGQPEMVSPPEAEEKVTEDGWGDLGHSLKDVVRELVSRGVWTRSEYDQFARDRGLMPMAMMDSINEWSDEEFGDLLILDGDPLTINEEIVGRIEECR